MTPLILNVQTDRLTRPVLVQTATTPLERSNGYRGKPEPASDGEGILFLFPEPVQMPFTMVGVPFSLDIWWGDRDGRVFGGVRRMKPGVPGYFPQRPLSFAVELKAGWSERNGTPFAFTWQRR